MLRKIEIIFLTDRRYEIQLFKKINFQKTLLFDMILVNHSMIINRYIKYVYWNLIFENFIDYLKN